ncbi:hypothetical protein ACGC1H_006830 [Rhizoctonia solani]
MILQLRRNIKLQKRKWLDSPDAKNGQVATFCGRKTYPHTWYKFELTWLESMDTAGSKRLPPADARDDESLGVGRSWLSKFESQGASGMVIGGIRASNRYR